MARVRYDEAENYGGNGGHGYFSLSNDKDTARVRFMYNSIDELVGYAVHECEVDGRKRYVNCLRSYDQPVTECPFCANHQFQTVKLYIPVYMVDTGEVKLWERGKKFIAKMTSLLSRYPNPVNTIFEIERNGAKGDTNTSYEIYPMETDDTIMEDLPPVPEIVGGVILDKPYAEMEEYMNTGKFPEKGVINTARGNSNVATRRTPSRREVPANRQRESF